MRQKTNVVFEFEDEHLIYKFMLWCKAEIYKKGTWDEETLSLAVNRVIEFHGADLLQKRTVEQIFKSIRKTYTLIEEGEL